jgi:hypothetical protein
MPTTVGYRELLVILIEISLEFGIEIKKIPADLQETAYLVS